MRALVIEGGSMRAAYANGVLAALEDAGYREFDAVYGTSAGAALAAWFSAGQANHAVGTWEYANDRRILSWRRWATAQGPLLDHDTLFEVVYEKERPLDVAAVTRAPWKVIVTATELATGRTHYQDIRSGNVLKWLRASGRLPLAAGEPVEIDGTLYVDGGVTDPIPIGRAIMDGATEILCVLNRPAGERRPEPAVSAWFVGRRYPQLREHVESHHRHHNEAVRLAEKPPHGVHVEIVRPRKDLGIRRFTRDVKAILRAAEQGKADGKAWLAQESGLAVELGPPGT